MADEPVNYIFKSKKGESLYEKLHAEGLEILQKLSGDVWTDFNEHDPGVTILENIVYVLTELHYKSLFPIRDLLLQSTKAQLESGDNGMFIASDILTTSPVTIADYRKLFYDQIDNVKNAWVYAIDDREHAGLLKGLYRVFIEMYDYNLEEDAIKSEHESIIKKVKSIFRSNRNFCQDLYEVVILKPYHLRLKFNINLSQDVDVESVLAEIFFKTNACITKQINYYSLSELQKKGIAIDEIFDGPFLKHGFILDQDLKGLSNTIVFEDIIKLIFTVEGVTKINSFVLYPENSHVDANAQKSIRIPDGYSPFLVFPDIDTDFVFHQGGMQYKPDLKETSNKLMNLQAEDYNRFQTVSASDSEINIPRGEYLNVASYYPVRNQFPGTYGIGLEGLPTKGLPPERYAQVKQLKAYLLAFDQLMANYLEQLDQVFRLYRRKSDIDTTNIMSYFFQQPEDMSLLADLTDVHACAAEGQDHQSWEEALASINERFDKKAIDRLNQIADNILARYSEQFNTYTLQKINDLCFGENSSLVNFKGHLLVWKRKLIEHYADISINRARASDYPQTLDSLEEHEHDMFTPALVHKLSILMGIKNCHTRPLSGIVAKSGISIYEHDLHFISDKIRQIFPEKAFDIHEFEEYILVINNLVEDITGAILFIGNKKTILKDVLKDGVIRSNYIIKDTKEYILFKGELSAGIIHVPDKQAEKVIDETLESLFEVSEESEGMFLLEHILLAPPYHQNYFGFRIELSDPIKGMNITFIQQDLKSMEKRNHAVAFLTQNFSKAGALDISITPRDKEFVLEIKNQEGEVLAFSHARYRYHEEIVQAKTWLENLPDTFQTTEIRRTFLSYYGNYAIDETFFSFRMSFILPDWPVRFQNEMFRRKFESLVYEQAPIHIVSDVHWWDIHELSEFENIYYKWMELVAKESVSEERMHYSHRLINMLRKHSN